MNHCEVNPFLALPDSSPVREYISILRSYLSEVQKAHVLEQVEARCNRYGSISFREYANILQDYLDDEQKITVVQRLENVFYVHGWTA